MSESFGNISLGKVAHHFINTNKELEFVISEFAGYKNIINGYISGKYSFEQLQLLTRYKNDPTLIESIEKNEFDIEKLENFGKSSLEKITAPPVSQTVETNTINTTKELSLVDIEFLIEEAYKNGIVTIEENSLVINTNSNNELNQALRIYNKRIPKKHYQLINEGIVFRLNRTHPYYSRLEEIFNRIDINRKITRLREQYIAIHQRLFEDKFSPHSSKWLTRQKEHYEKIESFSHLESPQSVIKYFKKRIKILRKRESISGLTNIYLKSFKKTYILDPTTPLTETKYQEQKKYIKDKLEKYNSFASAKSFIKTEIEQQNKIYQKNRAKLFIELKKISLESLQKISEISDQDLAIINQALNQIPEIQLDKNLSYLELHELIENSKNSGLDIDESIDPVSAVQQIISKDRLINKCISRIKKRHKLLENSGLSTSTKLLILKNDADPETIQALLDCIKERKLLVNNEKVREILQIIEKSTTDKLTKISNRIGYKIRSPENLQDALSNQGIKINKYPIISGNNGVNQDNTKDLSHLIVGGEIKELTTSEHLEFSYYKPRTIKIPKLKCTLPVEDQVNAFLEQWSKELPPPIALLLPIVIDETLFNLSEHSKWSEINLIIDIKDNELTVKMCEDSPHPLSSVIDVNIPEEYVYYGENKETKINKYTRYLVPFELGIQYRQVDLINNPQACLESARRRVYENGYGGIGMFKIAQFANQGIRINCEYHNKGNTITIRVPLTSSETAI